MAILHSLQFIAYGLVFSGARHQWFPEIITLVILLYFAAVWYSYGEFIEDIANNLNLITVHNSQTNQQVTYPLGGGNENNQMSPMNQPNGGRNPGQGPSTLPSAPPLNTPQAPYVIPGPGSAQ
ncbi:uncharacterized protein LOC129001290 [Macrosteles quadrilineatus]|uniref:uncharacterized protein LOC129001290 n=1 Tax=Macrosteles quadrilineatus TaxID=74068 RepID=UPI0023E33EEB|nr:uncharacterized protein LOC129001290 [Macrosteles quadrilineatus]